MITDHYNITVSGKVQGVGFRYSCKKHASGLGLKGFVRNLVNGDVYIEAEGSKRLLVLFINWCHVGPTHARVTNVYYTKSSIKDFKYFDIIG